VKEVNRPHAFRFLIPTGQPAAFLVLTVSALILMGSLQLIGAPLITDAAPAGIVSFELAGTVPAAQRMLASWQGEARIYAGLSLGLDFLFMPAYAGAIGLGSVLVGRALRRRAIWWETAGMLLSWVLPLAAILDVVENIALIRLLLGATETIWPTLARWCALPKFALVALGLVFIVAGGLLTLLDRRRAR
jgi:hypothetical protein